MKPTQLLCFYLNLFLILFFPLAHAGKITWVNQHAVSSLDYAKPTSPPREYFSLNTLYLDNHLVVHIGYDSINQNYVVMPSPNILSIADVGNKKRVMIQQYFPDLENEIASAYNVPANKLSYLYITSYEVYDQDGRLVDRILLPKGTKYRPPQFYNLDVSSDVKVLSFIFTFNGRTAWSDSGINADLQGTYRNLAEIDINRDNAIHLDVKNQNEVNTYEVLTSRENQKIQEVLSELHHIVVWGHIAEKKELINRILDLKNFEIVDIDLAKGVESLSKYPQLFGDPLNPKWTSVINHIGSQRLTESEASSDRSVSAKLGLGSFFNFGGRGSAKQSARSKEMVQFEVDGTIYVPKSLHFAVRTNESFDLIKKLIFQAYEQLEEADFQIGVGVSLDQIQDSRLTGNHLFSGEQLHKGESLLSENGKYQLILQEDGNLVLYKKDSTTGQLQWLWDNGSSVGKSVSTCLMQADGNLVLYDYKAFVWATMTQNHPGAYLVLQDDGNLVIYHQNKAIWWTGAH